MYCPTVVNVLCMSNIVFTCWSVFLLLLPSVSYVIVTWYVFVSRFRLAAPFPIKWGIISFGIMWTFVPCCGFGFSSFVVPSSSGIWAILSDSLGVSEVKKSVTTLREQLTGLFTDITRSQIRDLRVVLA